MTPEDRQRAARERIEELDDDGSIASADAAVLRDGLDAAFEAGRQQGTREGIAIENVIGTDGQSVAPPCAIDGCRYGQFRSERDRETELRRQAEAHNATLRDALSEKPYLDDYERVVAERDALQREVERLKA